MLDSIKTGNSNNQEATSQLGSFSYHKNPLVVVANTLLNAIPQIRHSAMNIDPAQLRNRLIDEIRRFEVRAQQAGLPYEVIIGARYCLCTVLDEAAALTPWGSHIWSKNGLLVTFHNETWGGEKFFQLLAKISQNPHEHLYLLELISICLLFGFEGRYRVIENGRSQLETIIQRLLKIIQDIRGNYPPQLSLHAEDRPVLMKFWRPIIPLWSYCAVIGFVCSLVFISLNWWLSDLAYPVEDTIFSTAIPVAKIKGIDIPVPVAPVKKPRLKELLAEEIKQGILYVYEDDTQSTVIFRGDGLFTSGTVTVNESYIPTFRRIAEELNQLNGKISIIGHTDNVPIRRARFANNWELSLARAEVVQKIINEYLSDPSRTYAQGRGDRVPIASNDTPEGRAQNRRVEITLIYPNDARNTTSLTTDLQ